MVNNPERNEPNSGLNVHSTSAQTDVEQIGKKLRKTILGALLLSLASVNVNCTLDKKGTGAYPPETGNDAGGSAGEGGIAGQGGSAGEAGNGGSAGEGGCFPTEEVCDGTDNDCNGEIDDNLTPPACEKTLGVCANPVSLPVCEGTNGWTSCEYGPDYEKEAEYTCDGLDNDCDGLIDEMIDLDGYQPACPEPDKGVCQGATAARTCESGQWTACDYGTDYSNDPESSYENCTDQLDNDCDGLTDCDDPDCDNICKAFVTLAVPPNVCHKQVRLSAPGASTWISAGSSNNDTLCTLNEISFVPANGNRLLLWVDSNNQITVSTITPNHQVSAGCSNYNYNSPNAPSLPNMVNEEKILTLDTDVTAVNNGNEITYTHNKTCTSPTNNHVFVFDYL